MRRCSEQQKPVTPPDDAEWLAYHDAKGCPNDELAHCLSYEYLREPETDAVRREVLRLRRKFGRRYRGASFLPYETPLDEDLARFLLLFGEWPGTPWIKIPPDTRKRKLAQLLPAPRPTPDGDGHRDIEGSWTDLVRTGKLHEFESKTWLGDPKGPASFLYRVPWDSGHYFGLKDKVSLSDKSRHLGEHGDEIVFVHRIELGRHNKYIVADFKRWLENERRKRKDRLATEPRGKGSPIVRARERLKWLAVRRLSRVGLTREQIMARGLYAEEAACSLAKAKADETLGLTILAAFRHAAFGPAMQKTLDRLFAPMQKRVARLYAPRPSRPAPSS